MEQVLLDGRLTRQTTELLVQTLSRVIDGSASQGEVTDVLRRVCDESRRRPPELIVVQLKELWSKIAGSSGLTGDARDRRYFAVLGEYLALYYEGSRAHPARSGSPRFAAASGCGEPESAPLR